MRKLFHVIICLVFTIAVGCQSALLRRDPDDIRAQLLAQKPLGSPMNEVEEWAKNHRWSDVRVNHKSGFYRDDLHKPTTIGVKSIKAVIGEYRAFPIGITTVVVRWAFDEKEKLVDVWVSKPTDSL